MIFVPFVYLLLCSSSWLKLKSVFNLGYTAVAMLNSFIIVMREGRVTADLPRAEATQERLIAAAAVAIEQPSPPAPLPCEGEGSIGSPTPSPESRSHERVPPLPRTGRGG